MIQKGDIYYILPFDGGSSGYRAAVVVSADEINQKHDKVSVAYLSSKRSTEESRTHANIRSSGRRSYAVLEGVTTLPKTRLGACLGHVTAEEGISIDAALCVAFGL